MTTFFYTSIITRIAFDIPISVAIGYVWTDTEEKNLEVLIQHADDEMYKDKKAIKKVAHSV